MQTTQRVSHLSDSRQFASSLNIARRKTDAIDLSSDQLTVTIDRNAALIGNFDVTGLYTVGGVQVLKARDAGWTADAGTASKASHATYAAGTTLTFSATYTQSELTAMATRMAAVEAALQGATQEIKAMKDLALLHGFAGA